jgi:hypothetical protein
MFHLKFSEVSSNKWNIKKLLDVLLDEAPTPFHFLLLFCHSFPKNEWNPSLSVLRTVCIGHFIISFHFTSDVAWPRILKQSHSLIVSLDPADQKRRARRMNPSIQSLFYITTLGMKKRKNEVSHHPNQHIIHPAHKISSFHIMFLSFLSAHILSHHSLHLHRHQSSLYLAYI